MIRLTRVHTSVLHSLTPCKHVWSTAPVLHIWLVDCGVSKSSRVPAGTPHSHLNLLCTSCMRYPCKQLSWFQSQGCVAWVLDFSVPMTHKRTFITFCNCLYLQVDVKVFTHVLCSFQLCVNIVNERLRRYVSEMLFQQEQAECVLEGVPMETPCSPCNQPAVLDFFLQVLHTTGLDWCSPVWCYLTSEHWCCGSGYTDIKIINCVLKDVQLVQFPVVLGQFSRESLSVIAEISSFHLQRPQGLLCLLDEESQSPRPAEQALYKRLSAQLESSPGHGLSLTTKDGNGNPPPKDQGPAFTVSHYARQVCML